MRKILFAMAALAAFAVPTFASHTSNTIAGDANIWTPTNERIVELRGSGDTALDSINTTGKNLYGPYAVSISNQRPYYGGFRVLYPNGLLVTAADSVVYSYQLIGGDSWNDTISSGWTPMDTVRGDVGKKSVYVSLANTAAKAIVFKVYVLGATPVKIKKKVRVIFVETTSDQTKAYR